MLQFSCLKNEKTHILSDPLFLEQASENKYDGGARRQKLPLRWPVLEHTWRLWLGIGSEVD
jgi:hypothetical protein